MGLFNPFLLISKEKIKNTSMLSKNSFSNKLNLNTNDIFSWSSTPRLLFKNPKKQNWRIQNSKNKDSEFFNEKLNKIEDTPMDATSSNVDQTLNFNFDKSSYKSQKQSNFQKVAHNRSSSIGINNSKGDNKFSLGPFPIDSWSRSIKERDENRKLRVRTNFSRAVEKIGLIPRSIIRTSDRFRKQLFPGTETLLLQEFRISRYQILVSLKCLLALIFIPLTVHFLTKNLILTPLIEYLWNNNKNEIFLNSTQQEQALSELQDFENEIYFELLVAPKIGDSNKNIESWKEEHGLKNLSNQEETEAFNLKNKSLLPNYMIQGINTNKKVTSMSEEINPVVSTNNEIGKDTNNFFNPKVEFKNGVNALVQSTQTTPRGVEGVKKISNSDDSMLGYGAYGASGAKHQHQHQEKQNLNFQPGSVGPPIESERQTSLYFDQNKLLSQKQEFQEKTIALAIKYNQQSIDSLIRLTSDFITVLTLIGVILVMKAEIIILKSFLIETVYSFNDTTKSFLIIFITDLLVGFHSSPGWELFFQSILNRFGLPFTETSILLTVAIVPVFLDTLFKYWIFRYLNKISPTTVATLNAMRE